MRHEISALSLLLFLAASCGTPAADPDAGPLADTLIPPDASGDGAPDAPIDAAWATIEFPPASSATNAAVRGRAGDDTGVAAVRVAGVDATSSDGFATWQATVPLAVVGTNEVVVETEDDQGQIDPRAAAISVVYSPVLQLDVWVRDYNATTGRAYVMNQRGEALIAVESGSGAMWVVAGGSTGTGPLPGTPSGLAVDGASSAAYVIDGSSGALLRIDLATGDRAVISDTSTGAGPALSTPTAVFLDTDGGRALVTDDGLDSVARWRRQPRARHG